MKTCGLCENWKNCDTICEEIEKELKKVTVGPWTKTILLPSDSLTRLEIDRMNVKQRLWQMERHVELGYKEWMLVQGCPLTPRQKVFVYLYYFRGYTLSATGSVLDKSHQTVWRDLLDAGVVIKNCLNEKGGK